jgi:hypothetical protein
MAMQGWPILSKPVVGKAKHSRRSRLTMTDRHGLLKSTIAVRPEVHVIAEPDTPALRRSYSLVSRLAGSPTAQFATRDLPAQISPGGLGAAKKSPAGQGLSGAV